MDGANPANKRRWWLVVACLLPLVVSIFFARREMDSPNVSSRMDTIQSLVEHHTFCIDQSLLKFKVDVVQIDGRFYSDKPPLLSVLAAGVYLPLHAIVGLSFAQHAARLYHILTIVFVGVPLAFGLWLLARCLFLAGLQPKAAIAAVFLTGTGTMFLPYAVTFNNHVPAATAITAALYCMLRAETDSVRTARWLAVAGFAGAWAFNFDLAPGGVALLGFAALAFRRQNRWRNLVFYGAGAVTLLLLYIFLNWLVTRDFKPIYLHPEYYQYEGSVLLSYDALKRPYGKTFVGQLFHMFIGYRGFFLYSPILLFGLWETVWQIVRGERYRPYALVALAIPVLSACSYAMQTGGMAGGSYGMRWLLPATPLFAFFLGLALGKTVTQRARNLFCAAASFSIVIAAIGAPRPWSSNIRSPFTFLDNIAYFIQTLWPPAKPPVYWIVERTSLEKGYAYFEIGRWHMNHRFYREAIPDLERARELDAQEGRPYRTETDYYLGICYDAAGNPDLAVKAWERLLERDPKNVGALNNYARSLLRLNLRSSALVQFQRSLDINPDQPNVLRQMAEVCAKSGNKAKALELLRRLERLRSDDEIIRQTIQKLQNEMSATSTTTPAPPEKR